MSLPDATRSDRIYPLLQNLDLENLAFATLQGTGETLNIEEMNEDELRRLVLVNLARLTVKGEWDGLASQSGTLTGMKFRVTGAHSGGNMYAGNGIGFRYNSATYGVPAATVTTANLEGNSPFGGTSTGNPPTILLAWT
jgi:hypothetical protein